MEFRKGITEFIVLLAFVLYASCQSSEPTTVVIGSTVPTIESTAIGVTVNLSAVAMKSSKIVDNSVTDGFHHCTACPFQSDHHKCNDPFKLSKSFEVSADMCNAVNADKGQIDRLCTRYPKGYFFQCPKGGSSYTCKASCGVQVEDVGKGLLDADITDMPNGLLSGIGFNNKNVQSNTQNEALGLLSGMGDLFHPDPPRVHQSPFTSSNGHLSRNQFQHSHSPFQTLNHFAGPHRSYPGANPLFHQNGNMFSGPPNQDFLGFSHNQFHQGSTQPHHMFGNHLGFGQHALPVEDNFHNQAPKSYTDYMPVPPSPTQASLDNAQTSLEIAKSSSAPIPTSVSTVTSSVQGLDDSQTQTGNPSSIQGQNYPATSQRPIPKSNAQNPGIHHQPNIGNFNSFNAHRPQNMFGNFNPYVQAAGGANIFPQRTFNHGPVEPLHSFGAGGFMTQPVQKSPSQATNNFHNFLGGFDDFNNGFHGFAAEINGRNSNKQKTSQPAKQRSFLSGLFDFRRR